MTDWLHIREKTLEDGRVIILLQNMENKDEYNLAQRNPWGTNSLYMPKEWAEAILNATE